MLKGFSAALFQNNKPIAFASKALTPAEIRYANAERELLAVVYGCQKFHSYLYERLFVVRTDPLSLRTDPDAIKHHHVFKESYCVYNCMTVSSKVFQEEKWLQLTP